MQLKEVNVIGNFDIAKNKSDAELKKKMNELDIWKETPLFYTAYNANPKI